MYKLHYESKQSPLENNFMVVEVNDNMVDEPEIKYPFCPVEVEYALVECCNTNCTNGQWAHFECIAD